MIIDGRKVASGTHFGCDVCIVGTGPAGLTVADRLRGSGLGVILAESGGSSLELQTQRLYRGETAGDKYFLLDACRFRLLGGSSNRWGGICRPLDAEDFQERSWMRYSGWPIGLQELEPYFADAARLLQLADADFDLSASSRKVSSALNLSGADFENGIVHYSPETNFADVYRTRLSNDKNIKLLLHANLMPIRLSDSKVERLTFKTLEGRSFTIRARLFVLATGAIENARLLLASCSDRKDGIGNEGNVLGRFFMEHLHVPAGHLIANENSFDVTFYQKTQVANAGIARGIIIPRRQAQIRHMLPMSSLSIYARSFVAGTPLIGAPPEAFIAPLTLYNVLRSRLPEAATFLRRRTEFVAGLPMRLRTARASAHAQAVANAGGTRGSLLSLYFRTEQLPDPENRVVLGERTDALSVRRAKLIWRVSSADRRAVTSWLHLFALDVERLGLGRVIIPPDNWSDHIIGGPHHMGTTRMSSSPQLGVVNRNCRVHSVANLYVAGSSVFVTGGYANPTFTIVSLALRLADRLKRELGVT